MVSEKVLQELEAAVNNPDSYVKGSNLGKLRAAFDSMCMQVCNAVTGVDVINRMMVRRCINSFDNNVSDDQVSLIKALHKALVSCENTLHRKDYLDHSESIKGFIENELKSVVRELT